MVWRVQMGQEFTHWMGSIGAESFYLAVPNGPMELTFGQWILSTVT